MNHSKFPSVLGSCILSFLYKPAAHWKFFIWYKGRRFKVPVHSISEIRKAALLKFFRSHIDEGKCIGISFSSQVHGLKLACRERAFLTWLIMAVWTHQPSECVVVNSLRSYVSTTPSPGSHLYLYFKVLIPLSRSEASYTSWFERWMTFENSLEVLWLIQEILIRSPDWWNTPDRIVLHISANLSNNGSFSTKPFHIILHNKRVSEHT